MTITIYHNPRCSTSRKVLEAIREADHAPEIIDYLERGWSEAELKALFKSAGVTAAGALRKKQPGAAALAGASEAAIVTAMVADPALVERPFVVTPKGARLCRPAARLNEIL